MKTLGLIGGMSWESTRLYYDHLNRIARDRLGGLHSARLILWSFDFDEIAALQAAGDWPRATERMLDAACALTDAGAEAIVICTNTMHLMAPQIARATGLPVVHIADATAAALKVAGVRQPLLLATRYTMESDVYSGRLRDRHGIFPRVPGPGQRDEVHRIIYDELCRGAVLPASRVRVADIVRRAAQSGADGVILGCTEIAMLIGPDDVALPVFDTTRLHAEAAMDFALGPGPA